MKISMALTIAALSAFLTSGCSWLGLAGSIGVIDGSDGPTAVYVTTKLAPGIASIWIPAVILAVLVAVGVIAYILRRKNK